MECKICRISTSGIHYQTRSCRACAAFFRRTIKMKLKYKCLKNGSCNVVKENRYSCRQCRLEKCLAKGMVFEEDSNLPDNVQCSESEEQMEQSTSSAELSFYSTRKSTRDQKQFFLDYQKRLAVIFKKEYQTPQQPYFLSLCQQVAVAYEKHVNKWPESKSTVVHSSLNVNKFLLDFCKEMEHIAEFCMEIEPFACLDYDQKQALYRRFSQKFHITERVAQGVKLFGNDLNDTRGITVAGEIFDTSTVEYVHFQTSSFKKDQVTTMMKTALQFGNSTFAKPYKKFNPDSFEMCYLIGASMWSTEGNEDLSPETKEKADLILESLAEELYFYYKFKKRYRNYAKRIYRLHNLICGLDRMADLHDHDGNMARTFDLFNFDNVSFEKFHW